MTCSPWNNVSKYFLCSLHLLHDRLGPLKVQILISCCISLNQLSAIGDLYPFLRESCIMISNELILLKLSSEVDYNSERGFRVTALLIWERQPGYIDENTRPGVGTGFPQGFFFKIINHNCGTDSKFLDLIMKGKEVIPGSDSSFRSLNYLLLPSTYPSLGLNVRNAREITKQPSCGRQCIVCSNSGHLAVFS
ncbi:unnamed protein product [Caretta caretta]